MTISYDFSTIKPLITPNSLLLTPNSRTQKALLSGQLLAIAQPQSGNSSQSKILRQTVDAQSLSQWIDGLWQALSFELILPKKISSAEINFWLEKQIKYESAWSLTNPSGVASKVLEAYKNLIQWRVQLNQIVDKQSQEIDYFKIWIKRLEAFCYERSLVADFTCLDFITNKLIDDEFDATFKSILPQHILLIGFNQFTPLEEYFFENLKARGIKIEYYEGKKKSPKAKRISFNQLQNEFEFAATYALKHQKKTQSIGIVVEQLASHLTEVHEAFSRVFHPEEEKPWVKISKPNYNVSAAKSLADQAIIKAAFRLLKLNAQKISIEDIHFLKNSPFIHWKNYNREIRTFLQGLCELPWRYFSAKKILQRIDKSDAPHELDELALALQLIDDQESTKKTLLMQSGIWRDWLNQWHWGKDERLNEFEVLAKDKFNQLFDSCQSLSLLYDSLNLQDGLHYLQQQAQQQSFQIASDRTQVHILGILEAAGLEFDQLIIVGFNQQNWPQKSRLNPFIPLQLQRELNMPGNSAEREYEYAESLSQLLLQSADNIIVTYSDPEGRAESTVSPFFNQLAIVEASDYVQQGQCVLPPADYSWIEDNEVETNQFITGGAYLLSEYASCPFKSLLNFSLKIADYPTPEIGIDAKTKGAWLHAAMESVWNSLLDQKTLLEKSDQQIAEIIETSLRNTLEKYHSYLIAVTAVEVIEIEFNKLAELMREWLEIEKQRSPFMLNATEKNYQLTLGELELKFRVDRIDNDPAGNKQIIDYKTGKTELKNWFGVRPTEAQMPAYLLALANQQTTSLSYAKIKTGEVEQQGLNFNHVNQSINQFSEKLAVSKEWPSKIYSQYQPQQLIKHWQTSLSRIAKGITSGFVPVSPKDPVKSCRYCEYHSICRINENQPESLDETDSEGVTYE